MSDTIHSVYMQEYNRCVNLDLKVKYAHRSAIDKANEFHNERIAHLEAENARLKEEHRMTGNALDLERQKNARQAKVIEAANTAYEAWIVASKLHVIEKHMLALEQALKNSEV